ncbi:hypothetical protein HKCCE3408_13700 [Rhodobacterales bacterium HKCCE3408]|nr:hypothetical protein [Rhodobacterales bacterium HKCCE3408]
MRLVFIRDWLDGGGWFDTTIDRVLPPEGLSMHWSRYADAPMAALIVMLSVVVGERAAEGIAIVLWPTALLVAFLAATGLAAHRIAGRTASGIAVIGACLWSTTANIRFGPLNIDHHGLQLVLMLLVVLILMRPGRHWRDGLLSGLVCAVSLAIGLEMIPAIILAGSILVARCVASPAANARPLAMFGFSLPVATALLFVGQTPFAEWTISRCDELAGPVVVPAASSGLAVIALAFGCTRLPGLGPRIGLTVLAVGVAAAAALPAMAPCAAGPYSNLSGSLGDVVATIPEARSVSFYFGQAGTLGTVFVLILPMMASAAFATMMLFHRKMRSGIGRDETRALLVVLCFGWLGFIASFVQFRMMAPAEAVTPVLMGVAGAGLVRWVQSRPTSRGVAVAAVAGLALMLVPGQAYWSVVRLIPAAHANEAAPGPRYVPFNACRQDASIVQSLNELPPANLMALGNLSRPILLLTGHRVLVSSYHRSETLMANMTLTSETDLGAFRDRLAASGTEYLVLCGNSLYRSPDTVATRLAGGEILDGFSAVMVGDRRLRVLRFEP